MVAVGKICCTVEEIAFLEWLIVGIEGLTAIVIIGFSGVARDGEE